MSCTPRPSRMPVVQRFYLIYAPAPSPARSGTRSQTGSGEGWAADCSFPEVGVTNNQVANNNEQQDRPQLPIALRSTLFARARRLADLCLQRWQPCFAFGAAIMIVIDVASNVPESWWYPSQSRSRCRVGRGEGSLSLFGNSRPPVAGWLHPRQQRR